MTAIEFKEFGDFDVCSTSWIMIHPDKIRKSTLLNEFYQVQGISSCTGLSDKVLSTISEDFSTFLELKWFKRLITQEVYFSD